jgi:LmbE family N-acetylglucosaminyl deacetylase
VTLPRPLVAISPHCDDAVFGCGEMLVDQARSTVITVFAGAPRPGQRLTRWDADAGFGPGDAVMSHRRAEDRAALDRLGAQARWLSFRDAQYEGPVPASAVIERLDAAVIRARPGTVLLPLGLFHDDHKTTHEAGIEVARRHPAWRWLLYADAMYRTIPGLAHDRLAGLRARGWAVAPHVEVFPRQLAMKRSAVACYASQLRALSRARPDGAADVFATEQYWQLTP